MAESEVLGGDELTALHGTFGELLTDAFQVTGTEALQHAAHRVRQRAPDLLVVLAEIELTTTDLLIEQRAFLHQGDGDEHHRQDDDEQDHEQGTERAEVTAVV